jgi:hypothetical protein
MRLPEESVIVICPNPKCGREIEEPILLTNLSVKPTEQYDACPHCFTKLIPETPFEPDEATLSEEDEILETSRKAGSQALKKVEDLILGSSENKEETKETGCPEKFGYLANRPKDAPIPPDCLLCPKMVDCMLKTKE